MAAVSPTGAIKGLSKGTANITATAANGKKARLIVKVVTGKAVKVKKAAISGAPKTLTIGKTKQLKGQVSPAKATGAVVTWKSSKKSVIAVDRAGKLTAKKEGTAKITLSAGGKKRTVTIKAVADVRSVKVNKKSLSLKKGKSTTLKAKADIRDGGGKARLEWKSNNRKVATVNGKGKVTAKKKGRATITVSAANGKKAKVKVIVK